MGRGRCMSRLQEQPKPLTAWASHPDLHSKEGKNRWMAGYQLRLPHGTALFTALRPHCCFGIFCGLSSWSDSLGTYLSKWHVCQSAGAERRMQWTYCPHKQPCFEEDLPAHCPALTLSQASVEMFHGQAIETLQCGRVEIWEEWGRTRELVLGLASKSGGSTCSWKLFSLHQRWTKSSPLISGGMVWFMHTTELDLSHEHSRSSLQPE